MKVDDVVRVMGRGYVFCGEPDREVHVGLKVRKDDAVFNIIGVERLSHIKRIGLVLSPNTMAGEMIKPRDDIEIT